MPDKVKLWCWVHGDALHRVFPVRVKLSDTIFELQEAIQERKPSFKNIDADSLELRKVGELSCVRWCTDLTLC